MIDPKQLYDEFTAKYGEENSEMVLGSMAACTMALIDFLALQANVSFEIMCQALILTDKELKEETNEH